MSQPAPAEISQPVAELHYAAVTRRRSLRRRLFLPAFLLLLAASLWWWREPLLAYGTLQLAQNRCASHRFAPDTVVATSDDIQPVFGAPTPTCWRDFQIHGGFAASLQASRTRVASTLAFLHELKSPSGTQRKIVAVDVYPLYLSSASILQAFHANVVTPADPWSLQSRPGVTAGRFTGGYPVRMRIQVFGGQPHPTDPSRFQIDYRLRDQPGVIEGQLLDDGSVTLRLRDGSPDVLSNWSPK